MRDLLHAKVIKVIKEDPFFGITRRATGDWESEGDGRWKDETIKMVDAFTSWSDPHVLLTIQHEAAHWLALWTVCCSLAH